MRGTSPARNANATVSRHGPILPERQCRLTNSCASAAFLARTRGSRTVDRSGTRFCLPFQEVCFDRCDGKTDPRGRRQGRPGQGKNLDRAGKSWSLRLAVGHDPDSGNPHENHTASRRVSDLRFDGFWIPPGARPTSLVPATQGLRLIRSPLLPVSQLSFSAPERAFSSVDFDFLAETFEAVISDPTNVFGAGDLDFIIVVGNDNNCFTTLSG